MKKRLLKILPIILIAICSVFLLTACVDADVEVQKQKMVSKGYIAHDVTTSGGYNTMGAEAAYHFVINDTAGNAAESVYILYFSSDNDAVLFEENFLKYSYAQLLEKNPDAIDDKGYQYARIGKVFIHGTDYAYDDAMS